MRTLLVRRGDGDVRGSAKSTIHAVFDRCGRQARRRAAPSCGVPSMNDNLKVEVLYPAQGVGLRRIVHMDVEHGEGIALMKAIKKALDPKGS